LTGGEEYSVSGKLIDSATKKPVTNKEISVTTEGNSSQGTDTTNSKGEFKVDLKAPDSPGKYDIKAHFDGDSQYKSSDSSVKITVEETKVSSQKNSDNKPGKYRRRTDR
jgi:Carboxypeptidase regulatory-like domain